MPVSRRGVIAAGLGSAGFLVTPAFRLEAQPVRYPSDPFTLGVASGFPEPNAVTLWTRLAPSPLQPGGGMPATAVPVDWEVAADDLMRNVVRSGSTWATPDWAHSVHVEVAGLAPGRKYWYRFKSGNARSQVGRTMTAPAPGTDVPRLTIGVASCQHYERFHWAAYRDMAESDLDLVIHVGDYIYENRGVQATRENGFARSHDLYEPYTLSDYRQRYALYKLDPLLQAAHAASPWLVTSDDHEVDNDYAGAISQDNDDPALFLERRAAAYQAYYEHLPMPRRLVPLGPYQRLHTGSRFGSLLDLFVLDGRQHRSDQPCSSRLVTDCEAVFDENRTMLGEAQERWLDGSLASARARWTMLAQQTVFAHMDQAPGDEVGYWADGWSGYAAARQRLLDRFAAYRTRNPIILSGDIHAFLVNDVHARPGDIESPVAATEFVTTSISSGGPDQSAVEGWRSENPNVHYGHGDLRGYLRLSVTPESVQADMVAVDDPSRVDSATHTAATFHVEDGRPGAMR